jgi:NAD-dependent dihydropyrimidine dehydrogenase PreA subunit
MKEMGEFMKTLITGVVTMAFVVVFSILSVQLWGEKEEVISQDVPLTITAQMTVGEFAESNQLSRPLLKEIFSLSSKEQLQQPVGAFGLSLEEIVTQVHQKRALAEEESSKNWFKIPLKFALWFVFLALSFVLLRRKKITRKTRMVLYLSSFVVFGVVLGADPSPMGTVKDAIVLYGAKGVVFKPRLVAFGVFTLTVVLANKFICSWGCQLGTLQDFLFRLNRNSSDSAAGSLPQVKLPFVVTNTIRILFLIALTWVAFAWAYDISHEIDPFKIFKPLKLSLWGWGFVGGILLASLFVYRPWCHLFCPFGLTGWLFEKLSVFKIKVDYDKCIDCRSCEKACPSTVMAAILDQDKKVIPDCFSCGNCLESCPTDAVSFSCGRRQKPPITSQNE